MSDTEWIEAKISDVYLTKSAVKGTPSVHFELAVGPSGRKMEHDLWLTQKTVERAGETLAGIGFNVKKDDFRHIGDILRGKECRVGIGEEEWNGEIRERVKWINPSDNAGAPDDRDAAVIVEELFGMSAPARGKKLPKPEVNSAGKTPNEDDESGDVPFALLLPFVLAALGVVLS